MNLTDHKATSGKWVSLIMAFAFFWLLMGDLIAIHQKAIYGFDPFGHEIPFTKTDNKSKLDKGQKSTKVKDAFKADFAVKTTQHLNIELANCYYEFCNTYTIFASQSGHPLIALRAPPSC